MNKKNIQILRIATWTVIVYFIVKCCNEKRKERNN